MKHVAIVGSGYIGKLHMDAQITTVVCHNALAIRGSLESGTVVQMS